MIILHPPAGQAHNPERYRKQSQKRQQTSRSRPHAGARRARDFGARKFEGRPFAGLAAQERVNRQQNQQRQGPRILKFKLAVHLLVAQAVSCLRISSSITAMNCRARPAALSAGAETVGENFRSSHTRRKSRMSFFNGGVIFSLRSSACRNSPVVSSPAGNPNTAPT